MPPPAGAAGTETLDAAGKPIANQLVYVGEDLAAGRAYFETRPTTVGPAYRARVEQLAPEHLRTAVARLDDVLKIAPSGSSGTRRAQEGETQVAPK